MPDQALIDLAERAEAATAEQQRELLDEAFDLLRGRKPQIWTGEPGTSEHTPEYAAWIARAWRFGDMLEAEAYESAALMLLPEGWVIGSLDWWPMRNSSEVRLLELSDHRRFGYDCDLNDDACGYAPTPALALTAACLRAHAEGEGS